MAIHAYFEEYVAGAQRILGDAVDFAVMTLGLEPDVFGRAFAVSMEEISGFSQSELAAESGVPLRQIQLFEQRQRNINKTAAETLLRLSKTLCCRMEDLMEK